MATCVVQTAAPAWSKHTNTGYFDSVPLHSPRIRKRFPSFQKPAVVVVPTTISKPPASNPLPNAEVGENTEPHQIPSTTDPTSGIDYKTLFEEMQPLKQCPPLAENCPEDYTDEKLQIRNEYLRRMISDNGDDQPNVWRFMEMYEFFLSKASKIKVNPNAVDEQGNMTRPQRDRLQACRQLLLFDSICQSLPHHCDVPRSSLGREFIAATVDMLKYTLYTRYHCYLGRKLPSLDFAIDEDVRYIMKATVSQLKMERRQSRHESASNTKETYAIQICEQIDHFLRLLPGTVEDAMYSFNEYTSQHPESGDPGRPSLQEPTFELENHVRQCNVLQLAVQLYADFVLLDSLKGFVAHDIDIVHLQAVVAGFIKLFFDVECSHYEHTLLAHLWQANSVLEMQRLAFLHDGNERFTPQVRWKIRVEAERAEKKFKVAWKAVIRESSHHQAEAQALIGQYLLSLGVEDASFESVWLKRAASEKVSAHTTTEQEMSRSKIETLCRL